MNFPSNAAGGVAVVTVLILSLIAGVLSSARFSWFLIGLLFASIVWWGLIALLYDSSVSLVYGTTFALLTIGYGVVAFLLGKIITFVLRYLKTRGTMQKPI